MHHAKLKFSTRTTQRLKATQRFKTQLLFKIQPTLLIIFALTSYSNASELVRLTTKIWPPYHYYNQSGELVGKSVSVVQCAFSKLNTLLTIEVLPWARAQHAVKNNFADGFFSASRNATRDIYAVRTSAIAEQNWAWFYIDSNIDPQSKHFKSDIDVVATNGSNIANWLEKNDYRLVTKVAETENLVSMLLNNRIDVFMGNELAVETFIKENNITTKIHKSIARSMPVGIYLTKDFLARQDENYLPLLNNAIQQCRNEMIAL
ncbi:substrate-binding periplasmic protein [Marinicellulosiphila megalodicopiae]|uniref:substrate-binding periplasmic protein n=1 Tax=Marinicellulosiphila megalodicopiae TaxID=2724896 RepID=UPI003BB1381B